jgi:hypothetical protein
LAPRRWRTPKSKVARHTSGVSQSSQDSGASARYALR